MDKKRVALENLGCKLNYAETIQIEKEFRKRGFDVVDPSASTDVFVINTCTVTQRADSDCRQVVRRALRTSPGAFVVVTGCYAQGKPDEVAQIEGVDLVLGTREKFNLFDYVNDFKKQKSLDAEQEADVQANYHARTFVGSVEDVVAFGAADSAVTDARTRAFLKVQDGCSYNCSYCTIPKVRGASRNPSVAFLVDQAKDIAGRGFKEIVLSGVNVGDFQKHDGDSFFKLLTELEKVGGIDRIRISSIEPDLLTKEIVKYVASSTKYCKHFHVPLQNGSDEVLRRMRRRYNSIQYQEIVEYVKEIIPNAGIGADVIVGFPGETGELFEESLSFIENLPLSYLHVFSYSEREGTDAASFDGRVDPRVRKKRSEILRMLSAKKRYEFNRQHIGKIMKVLVEEEIKNGEMFGFTSNYIRVEMDSNPSKANKICDVLITGVSDNTVVGQVIL
jgi:threonylcarbamoyladenosine tRNA methylthiotransferase MtaB